MTDSPRVTDAALNGFSRRFADLLLATHPEWRSLVRLDNEGFPAPGALQVVIPSPVPGRHMLIRTSGDQVTVDLGPDGWHEHFLAQAHGYETSPCSAAIRFIDDLMTDCVLIATRFVAGRRLWSRAVEAGDVRVPRFGNTKIISWTGTRDATLSRGTRSGE